MSTQKFELYICNELIYANLDGLMSDLKSIGGTIEIEDDKDGGYLIKKSSIDKISNCRVPVRDRLARVCSALLFDLPIDVKIDNKTIFISAYDTVYILTNIGTDDDKYSLDYFKDKIVEAVTNLESLDSPIEDYENAKAVVSILKEWEEEDPLM